MFKEEIGIDDLYLDMDGILVDFDKKCIEHLGHKFNENEAGNCWKKINRIENFWVEMDPTPFCHELFEICTTISAIHNVRLHILTGTPSSKTHEAEVQKAAWIRTHLPAMKMPNVHFCRSISKYLYANHRAMLIDDRPSNIDAWKNAGGHGILTDHTNIDDILSHLKTL